MIDIWFELRTSLFSFEVLAPLSIILGALIGSFLNAAAWRIPKKQQAIEQALSKIFEENPSAPIEEQLKALGAGEDFSLLGRSRCTNCGTAIKWHQNIPVLSWLMLKGECSHCGTKISIQYPLIEAGLTALFLIAILSFEKTETAFSVMFFVAIASLIALIDNKEKWIPSELTQTLLWGGLLFSLFGISTVEVREAILGAATGFFALWAPAKIFELIKKTPGMGQGDWGLLAALGAWTGPLEIPLLVAIAATIQIIRHLAKKEEGVAFGPALVMASFLIVLSPLSLGNLISL